MRKILLSISLFFLVLSSALAQIADPYKPLENDPSIRVGKLENGLTYYIRHNDKPAQRAEFHLVTNVGAIQETPAQDGLAHFLEHMALNGTKNLPGKMMLDYFQTIGVEFGRNINAGTGVEMTSYMLNNIPITRQGIIDTALLIMHDYSAFVTNDPVEIDKERGVIIEEWRTRRTADWRMHEKELPFLYKGSKYGECTLIGSKTNLETFAHHELVDFYTTWYRPDLQAVIVVGDIDVDAIEAQIKSLFSDIPARVNPKPKEMHQIPNNAEPIVGIITDPEASNTSIRIYFKKDPLPKEANCLGAAYLTEMINSLISTMISERLQDISKQPNAPFLGAGMGVGQICMTKDAVIGQVFTKDGEGIKGFSALMTEFERAKRYGFTQSEYERATTNMLRSLERAKENADSRQNGEFIDPLTYNFIMGNPFMTPEYEYNVVKGYLSMMNVDQINQFVSQLNLSDNAVIIYKSVEKEGLVHPTEADFIASLEASHTAEIAAPIEETFNEPLVDESQLKGSTIKKTKVGEFGSTIWTLKNGITVIVKPTDFNKEEVLFRIYNQGGRSLIATEDLSALESNVFNTYLSNAGLSDFSDSKLTKMLAGKAVQTSPFVGSLEHGVNAMCSPKDFETLLQMIYLTYAAPRFEESEFQPGLDQLKTLIPNYVAQPGYQLQKRVTSVLYNNNPRNLTISPEMLENVNIASIEKVYRQLFSNAAGSVVSIVGNVDLATIKPLVEKYIGSLPVAKKATKWIDRNNDIVKGKITDPFEVPMTTSKTTVCMFIDAEMAYTPENIMACNAINYILDLIYTKTIREEEGGTYGVSANGSLSFDPWNEYFLQIQFDTDPEKAPRLIELAKAGLNGIAENGVTEEQLSMAKENFLKNLPENRINNSYWRNRIAQFYKYGINLDANYEELVNNLTSDQIRNFAKEVLSQGNMIEVIMSPAK